MYESLPYVITHVERRLLNVSHAHLAPRVVIDELYDGCERVLHAVEGIVTLLKGIVRHHVLGIQHVQRRTNTTYLFPFRPRARNVAQPR